MTMTTKTIAEMRAAARAGAEIRMKGMKAAELRKWALRGLCKDELMRLLAAAARARREED